MNPAGAIGKLGFRRWFERELMLAHGWLVASLLSAFAAFALLEDLSLLPPRLEPLPTLVGAFVAGAVAWYALARYLRMLVLALHLAERSTCERCGTYGRYRLVGATPGSMTVSCRKCDAEWTIP